MNAQKYAPFWRYYAHKNLQKQNHYILPRMTLSEYEMDMTDSSSLIDYCLLSVIDLGLVIHKYTKRETSEAEPLWLVLHKCTKHEA